MSEPLAVAGACGGPHAAAVEKAVVGFAFDRIDEAQARETLALLERMGEVYEQEVDQLREGTVG